MKKAFILLLTMLMVLPALAQTDPGYYISNYNVDMVVHEDYRFSITETIEVDFLEESHGIFRMIPNWVWVNRDISEKQDGSETKLMHYKVDISKMKTSEEWTEMSEFGDSLLAMRFGVEDRTFTGPHTYTLSYEYKPYGDRVTQSDLFFYSVLGAGWDCMVKVFMFNIHFDKPLSDTEFDNIEAFVGSLGNKDNVAKEIILRSTKTDLAGGAKNIPPRSAVTIRIPLHEGYYKEGLHPKLDIQLAWALAIISILLSLYLIYIELFGGEKITKVLSFYPPDDCSSADVGTLIDTSVDDQDMISLIPWFASKGYLTIDNTSGHPVLEKVMDLPDNAPKYQKKLFNGFFPGDKKTFDTEHAGAGFGNSWLNAMDEAKKAYSGKLNKLNTGKALILFIAVMALSFATYFATNTCDAYLTGGITTVSYLGIAFIVHGLLSGKKGCANYFMAIVGVGFLAMMQFAMFMGELNGEDGSYIQTDIILLANMFMLAACLLAFRLVVMTSHRRERIGQILGLHDFIDTAEKQQLQQLMDQDEQYFYNVLPYAVAFGMVKNWTKKFEGLTVPPADWYRGNDNNMMQGFVNMTPQHLMTKSMRSSIKTEVSKRAEAAAARSSSSSSSSHSYGGGGGGFSGGGFGGGGGGRW